MYVFRYDNYYYALRGQNLSNGGANARVGYLHIALKCWRSTSNLDGTDENDM